MWMVTPDPDPTPLLVELIEQASAPDPLTITLALIGAAVGVFGAVTGGLALWWQYRARTRPRVEAHPQRRSQSRMGLTMPFEDGTVQTIYSEILDVTVTNWGNGIAFRVQLHSSGENHIPATKLIGNMEPGQSKTLDLSVVSGPGVPRSRVWVTWDEYPGPKEQEQIIGW